MKPENRVLRSAPAPSKDYVAWLDKVQNKQGLFWRHHGLFDLIQLSREGTRYHIEMLSAALHFWESSTNTFHFKAGMMTPTLFDVAAIAGLKPTGPTYDPTYVSEHFTFDYKILTFSGFLKEHYNTDSVDVSDIEHIAFLTYWLSHFVFCTGSIQVVKRLVPMAIQIHEGKQFSLGKIILASLYDSLGVASDLLKKTRQGCQTDFTWTYVAFTNVA
jgi:hypothetical protein